MFPIDHPFFAENELFRTFGQQHMVMIVLTIVAAYVIPMWAARRFSTELKLTVARALALIVSWAVVAWTLIRIALGVFDPVVELPLDLCNLSALLMPFLMWKPSRRVHEILYFFVLAGTVQAVLTPHLINGFPNYGFFKYWIVHGGLIVVTVYHTWVYGLYPNWKSLVRAFGWLQVYTVAMFVVNFALGANYFYLKAKPPTASFMDLMPDWPWYLLICELLAFVLFAIVYLPLLGVRGRAQSAEALQLEQVEL